MNTLTVTLEVPDALADVVAHYRDPATGARLSVPDVLAILADDLVMTETRPGSWEGTNMQAVVDAHGWPLETQ